MRASQDRFTLWGIEVFLATVEEASISAAMEGIEARYAAEEAAALEVRGRLAAR